MSAFTLTCVAIVIFHIPGISKHESISPIKNGPSAAEAVEGVVSQKLV